MIEIKNHCSGAIPPGFFSNFFIVLDWIHNSIYDNEKIFIDWSCGGPENLWTLFFEQLKFNEDSKNLIVNNFRCNYPREYTIQNINEKILCYNKYGGWFYNNFNLFNDEHFQNLRDEFHESYKKLELKKNIIDKINEIEKNFDSEILGVAVRIPSHFAFENIDGVTISKKMSPTEYYEKICDEVIKEFKTNKYKKIFICCDVKFFIDLMVEKVGNDNLIYTKYDRVKNLDSDWVDKNFPLKEEYELVLTDSLLLSKCSYIMGGSSNIFLSSLVINNKVNYKIFEILENSHGL
jgi:hypothetical protein